MEETLNKSQKQELFLKLYIENNRNLAKTAKAVGVSRKVVLGWMDEPEFKEQVETIEQDYFDWIEEVNNKITTELARHAETGDLDAVNCWQKWIIFRFPDKYGPESVKEGQVIVPPEIQFVYKQNEGNSAE